MAAITDQVKNIHWTNFVGTTCAIRTSEAYYVGVLLRVMFFRDDANYFTVKFQETDFLTFAPTAVVTIATLADASQILYGVPLGS